MSVDVGCACMHTECILCICVGTLDVYGVLELPSNTRLGVYNPL